jgi:hypothetical protein
LPLISYLEGRCDDLVAGPGGALMSAQNLTTLLRLERGVKRFQFRQESPESIELLLVGTPADPEGLRVRVEAGIAERIGPSVRLVVRPVEALPHEPSGKVRAVVSSLTRSFDAQAAAAALAPTPPDALL